VHILQHRGVRRREAGGEGGEVGRERGEREERERERGRGRGSALRTAAAGASAAAEAHAEEPLELLTCATAAFLLSSAASVR